MNPQPNTPVQRCLIIGDPVAHSLSPRMHTAAYHALGIDQQFEFGAELVKSQELARFIESVRGSNIRGLACTMPHKQAVIPLLDEIDTQADRVGAVNTVVNEDGKLKGYNTDWLGIRNPLLALTDLKDRNVLVLGAGGAARASLLALRESGATAYVTNRTSEKASALADRFNAYTVPWDERMERPDWNLIINTTSMGMSPNLLESPLEGYPFSSGQIVFETIYNPRETALIIAARKGGATVLGGVEMLLHQGMAQFELFTGMAAPAEAMRRSLTES